MLYGDPSGAKKGVHIKSLETVSVTIFIKVSVHEGSTWLIWVDPASKETALKEMRRNLAHGGGSGLRFPARSAPWPTLVCRVASVA